MSILPKILTLRRKVKEGVGFAGVAQTSPLKLGGKNITDRRTITIVVSCLALSVLGAVAGAIYLEAVGRTTPALVSDVAKIALGAIAALLARTSVDPGEIPAAEPSVAETNPFPEAGHVN